MMPHTQLLAICLLAAVFCGLVIIPLARLIPLHVYRQFNDRALEQGYAAQPVEAGEFLLSTAAKAAILAGCCLAGLLAAGIARTPLEAALSCFYLFGLILIAAINLKHSLLPDMLVLPLLGIGMLVGVHDDQVAEHVLGAMAGYVGPWLLVFLIKLTGKGEIIGPGDLKALAMAGAWFGLAAVPQIVGVFFGLVVAAMLLTLAAPRRFSMGTGLLHIGASVYYLLHQHVQ
jgi:prepilin signal peptidase PulO-like enzyme (type II secretory pathway)